MAANNPHDRTKERPALDQDDDDLDYVEKMLKHAGCLEKHYDVQYCMAENTDWRKCQSQVAAFRQCIIAHREKGNKEAQAQT